MGARYGSTAKQQMAVIIIYFAVYYIVTNLQNMCFKYLTTDICCGFEWARSKYETPWVCMECRNMSPLVHVNSWWRHGRCYVLERFYLYSDLVILFLMGRLLRSLSFSLWSSSLSLLCVRCGGRGVTVCENETALPSEKNGRDTSSCTCTFSSTHPPVRTGTASRRTAPGWRYYFRCCIYWRRVWTVGSVGGRPRQGGFLSLRV